MKTLYKKNFCLKEIKKTTFLLELIIFYKELNIERLDDLEIGKLLEDFINQH